MNNFVKYVLDNGGYLKPVIIPSNLTNGTGIFNPSVFVKNEKIFVNIRHSGYTLYHAELSKYEHHWGPLLYLAESESTFKTTNYICELNNDLNVVSESAVDTSFLDKNPLWTFVGLEDARLINWDDKFYISGVRRDTDIIGTGRIELSEIVFENSDVKEVARYRIPVPGYKGNKGSYCEKNWMPILDQPFHYVKWTNPTEVVKCDISDPENITCEQVFLGEYEPLNYDLKGGSQVIPYKDGYLCLTHVSFLNKSLAGRMNNEYKQQFVYWDKNWNILKMSRLFDFMCNKIEFCCGMSKYNDDYLISFGIQDNSSYILRVSEKTLEDFINA